MTVKKENRNQATSLLPYRQSRNNNSTYLSKEQTAVFKVSRHSVEEEYGVLIQLIESLLRVLLIYLLCLMAAK